MTSETEIFNWLDNSQTVSRYEVLDFQEDNESYLLKLKIEFTDKSELFTRESIKRNLRKYSFHWQSEDGLLIIRWDNADHHRELATFPHHRHEQNEDNVMENKEVALIDILKFILNKFFKD